MKKITGILSVLFSLVVLVSCGTSGKLSGSSKEDKDLFKAITAIEKRNNADARKDLPTLYEQSVQRHEDNIANYKSSNDPARWQNIINELEALQKIYGAVKASPEAARLIAARDYATAITEARATGAEENYNQAVEFLEGDNIYDARKAYQSFQVVNRIYPNYRNTSTLIREAREKGTLDVVINPVQTRGYAYGSWMNRADNFQRELVRDLGGSFGNITTGARFYTDWEARSQKVSPDWVVDLNWDNMYISQPQTRTYTRNLSKEIENGRDSAGKTIYKTVTATLYVTRRTLDARGDMEYRIVDLGLQKDVEWSRIPAYLDMNVEYATYRGDSRALGSYEWDLVNNRQYQYMDESDIVAALYSKIYSQLRSRIESRTRW